MRNKQSTEDHQSKQKSNEKIKKYMRIKWSTEDLQSNKESNEQMRKYEKKTGHRESSTVN